MQDNGEGRLEGGTGKKSKDSLPDRFSLNILQHDIQYKVGVETIHEKLWRAEEEELDLEKKYLQGSWGIIQEVIFVVAYETIWLIS